MNHGLDDFPDISPLDEWRACIMELVHVFLFFTAYLAAIAGASWFWIWLGRAIFGLFPQL